MLYYRLTLYELRRNMQMAPTTRFPQIYRFSSVFLGLIWPLLHRFSPECLKHKSSKVKGVFSFPTHQPTHHVLLMKLTSAIISVAALFSVASADNVRFNTFYDNPQTSLNNVACSNGRNGLVTKGFTTFNSLPSFPNIGAAKAVGAWNSTLCGSCWELTFGGNSIYVTAIDTVGDGFDISLEAMNTLTNGRAQQLDVVNALATQVDQSFCGL